MTTPASRSPRLPGDEGLWFFISADMVLFFLLFGSFASEQAGARTLFDEARRSLLPPLAALNTVFLLSSSLFAALAVSSIRRDERARARSLVGVTILLGLAFVVAKMVEYTIEAQAGVTLAGSSFSTFYFVITGLHLLHVIGGISFLVFIWVKLSSSADRPATVMLVESGASFWHMVDMLWLVIFPLLYLLP